MRLLNEGLDYLDFENQIVPTIIVDQYAAKIGEDDDIVTLAFIVKGKAVGEDLVEWLEKGYDFVLDAETSDGEYTPGKYLVFVEMDRRIKVPERICEIIEDMFTLTNIPIKDWTITYKDEDYAADIIELKNVMVLSPKEYRDSKEIEMNEMRELAGLETKKIYESWDKELKDFLAKAGL